LSSLGLNVIGRGGGHLVCGGLRRREEEARKRKRERRYEGEEEKKAVSLFVDDVFVFAPSPGRVSLSSYFPTSSPTPRFRRDAPLI
jgi:hypothetical protein